MRFFFEEYCTAIACGEGVTIDQRRPLLKTLKVPEQLLCCKSRRRCVWYQQLYVAKARMLALAPESDLFVARHVFPLFSVIHITSRLHTLNRQVQHVSQGLAILFVKGFSCDVITNQVTDCGIPSRSL